MAYLATRLIAVRSRVALGTLDQVASSASNVLVAVLIAKWSSPGFFGAYSLVAAGYVLVLGLNRVLLSEPYMISAAASGDARDTGGQIARLCAVAAAVASGVMLISAALALPLVSGSDWPSLIVLLLFFPVLAVQDLLRIVAFAWRKPQYALLSDTLWLTGVAGFGIAALARETPSAAGAITVWCLSGGISGLALSLLLRRFRSSAPGHERLRTIGAVRGLLARSRAAGLEFLLLTGGLQGSLYIAGAVLGVADLAGPRGAALLLGPMTIVVMGVTQSIMPIAVRAEHRSWRLIGTMQIAFVMATGLLVAAVFQLPDSVGVQILGPSWLPSKDVLAPVGVSVALLGLAVPMLMRVRILGASGRLFRRRAWIGLAYPLLALIGSSVGIEAFAWCMTIAQGLDTVLIAVVVRQINRDEPAASTGTRL